MSKVGGGKSKRKRMRKGRKDWKKKDKRKAILLGVEENLLIYYNR